VTATLGGNEAVSAAREAAHDENRSATPVGARAGATEAEEGAAHAGAIA
jgi:hypothetical protein